MASKSKSPKGVPYESVVIGEQERKLRYCSRSLRLAAHHGVSLDDVYMIHERNEEGKLVLNDARQPQIRKDVKEEEVYAYNTRMLWFGLIAFEPDLTEEEVEMDLSIGEMPAAVEAASAAFERFTRSIKKEEKDEDSLGESKAAA